MKNYSHQTSTRAQKGEITGHVTLHTVGNVSRRDCYVEHLNINLNSVLVLTVWGSFKKWSRNRLTRMEGHRDNIYKENKISLLLTPPPKCTFRLVPSNSLDVLENGGKVYVYLHKSAILCLNHSSVLLSRLR